MRFQPLSLLRSSSNRHHTTRSLASGTSDSTAVQSSGSYCLPTQPRYILHLVSLANYLQTGWAGILTARPIMLCRHSLSTRYLRSRVLRLFPQMSSSITAPLKTRTGFNVSPVPYCFVSRPPFLPCHGCHGTAHSVDRGCTSSITHPQLGQVLQETRRPRTDVI